MATSNLPKIAVTVKKADSLPDNKLWKNRFEIHSATSDRVYIVSQKN